jgi:hypothetical protein
VDRDDRISALHNLGMDLRTLQALVEDSEKPAVLAEIVEICRTSAALAAGSPDHAERLDALAFALRALGRQTGDRDLIVEAVAVRRRTLAALAPDAPERAAEYEELGDDLVELYKTDLDVAPTREALAAYRSALLHGAPGDRAYQYRMVMTALAALAVACRSVLPADRAVAIEAAEAALRVVPPGDEDVGIVLAELARLGSVWFVHTSDEADLDSFLRSARDGIARTPQEWASHRVCLGFLAGFPRGRDPCPLRAHRGSRRPRRRCVGRPGLRRIAAERGGAGADGRAPPGDRPRPSAVRPIRGPRFVS